MSAPAGSAPLVKICGVREAAHAAAARDAGADLIGMIFADARRRVDLPRARAIRRELGPRVEITDSSAVAVERARSQSRRPLLVGVFARQTPDEILRVLDQVDLDLVQLSGGEHPALAGRIPRAVIRATHVGDGATAESLLRDAGREPPTITLLDAASRQGGGTGERFDWSLARAVAERRPILLAGGLTPENVGEAIDEVRPWAVDVSSGVEVEGVKSEARIRAFVSSAKAAAQITEITDQTFQPSEQAAEARR